MVKVISGSEMRRTTCKCGAVLEYSYNDILSEDIFHYATDYYIICPCCKNRTRVPDWDDNEYQRR